MSGIDLLGRVKRVRADTVALLNRWSTIRASYLDRMYSTRGPSVDGRPYTCVLLVSPMGDGTDGQTWPTAFQTIQDALDDAPGDANEHTLILVGPTATYYDIDTAGDPTWAGNYEIVGPHRIWVPIRNTNAGATSILNFTGKASLVNLAFFMTGSLDGVSFTSAGWRVRQCGFNSSACTGAQTSVYINGSGALTRGGWMEDVQFLGHQTYTKAIHINKSTINEFHDVYIHDALTGVHIEDADSDRNLFNNMGLGDCGIGFDLDAGTEQHFVHVDFHGCTVNVDDEVHDHVYEYITGQQPITVYPDDVVGITVAANAAANVYGTNTLLRATGVALKPFRVVGVIGKPVTAQTHELRLSADGGTSHFNHSIIESARGVSNPAAQGTDYIFNVGVPISCSLKAESAGSDEMQVWLKIQEI